MSGPAPDYAHAVALAREARGAARANRAKPVSVLGLAVAGGAAISLAAVHASPISASLVAAGDVPSARIREVDVMKTLVTSASLMLASVSFAGQENLIVGGDFETVPQGGQGAECQSTLLPAIPGWNSNAGYQVDRFRNDAACDLPPFAPINPSAGVYYISLQGSVCCGCNNNGWIEQIVPTIAGRKYLLKAELGLDRSDSLRVTAGANTWILTGGKDIVWESMEFEFTAVGDTTIRFASESPTGITPTPWNGCWEAEGALLDNIQVVEKSPCVSDVIDNGIVDGADLSALLSVWGTAGGLYPRADCNGDGTVNGADLSIVLSGWGACPQ